jgi:integrase
VCPEPGEPATFRRNRFKPALTGAGVTRTVRLHDLRHSFASLCASEGIPSAQVAQWMGHASDVITREVYTHLFTADADRAAKAMARDGRPEAKPAPTSDNVRAMRHDNSRLVKSVSD